jgi:hypothetical protein
MFNAANKMFNKGQGARRGQIALLFILLIMVGLIFYAMSLNWAKQAMVSAQMASATNMAAASMASHMASHGESLLYGQLEGELEKCGWTGLFTAILTFLVILILVVLAFFTGGATLSAIPSVLTLALVLSAVSVVVQAAYVEPKITSLWNKMQADSSAESQVLENGYRTAMGVIISDQNVVRDKYDFDMDGNHGDNINRYAYLMSMRNWYAKDEKCSALSEFTTEIKALAKDLGIDEAKFNECMQSGRYEQKINSQIQDGVDSGARGTPYSVIVGPNNKKEIVSGALPKEKIKMVIDEMLK